MQAITGCATCAIAWAHDCLNDTPELETGFPVCRFQRSALGWVDAQNTSEARYRTHSDCPEHDLRASRVTNFGWKEDDAMDRLFTLLKRFLGSPDHSSKAYQTWHHNVSTESSLSDRAPTSFFSMYPPDGPRSSCNGRGRCAFLPRDLLPATTSFLGMCAFGFDNIILDWWDSKTEYLEFSNERGCPSLYLAALSGSTSTCIRLIGHGAKIDEQWGKELFGDEDFVPDYGDYSYKCGFYSSALGAAISRGYRGVAEVLIKFGADVNLQLTEGEQSSALEVAIAFDNHEIVALLLASGANVSMELDNKYNNALTSSVYYGNIVMVSQLLEAGAGADINQNHYSYFQYLTNVLDAIAVDGFPMREDILKLLIQYDVDLNMKLYVSSEESVLALAVKEGQINVVEMLLVAGADANKPVSGEFGCSALAIATFESNKKMMDLLLRHEADVNMLFRPTLYTAVHWSLLHTNATMRSWASYWAREQKWTCLF